MSTRPGTRPCAGGAPRSNGSFRLLPRRPRGPKLRPHTRRPATASAAGGTQEPARPRRLPLTCPRSSWVRCPRRRGLARSSHSVPTAACSASASPSSPHAPPPPQSPSSSPAEHILPPRRAAGGARRRSARRRHRWRPVRVGPRSPLTGVCERPVGHGAGTSNPARAYCHRPSGPPPPGWSPPGGGATEEAEPTGRVMETYVKEGAGVFSRARR